MARGCRKNIIKTCKEAIAMFEKVGVENVHGISETRKAMNIATGEWTEYRTIYYNVRAEFEISENVFRKLCEKGVLVLG